MDQYAKAFLTFLPTPTKSVEELTAEERVALCIQAGVAMTYARTGEELVASTVDRCSIVKVAGRFRVFEEPLYYREQYCKIPLKDFGL